VRTPFLALFLIGCDDDALVRDLPPGGDGGDSGRPSDSPPADSDPDTGEPVTDCPEGLICVESLPYVHNGDTTDSTRREFDFYSCATSTDESGPEVVYRVDLAQAGYLGAAIDDSTSGVDIDAHILGSLDAQDCLDRGNSDAGALLQPGYAYVVADTYVSGGVEQAGPYVLTLGLFVPSQGDCALETGWMERVGDGGDSLRMPAEGPMALEAHLVTVEDGYGTSSSDPWPASIEENIPQHHQLSQDATGFVMSRDQPWAPQESCEYGQGSYGAKLPVEDEGWYVNMYWSDRPDAGTRMILKHEDGRAVVVAAGYETGPGDLDYIGGTTEEVHSYLGTGHGSSLTLGFAVDQSLPLGPRICE